MFLFIYFETLVSQFDQFAAWKDGVCLFAEKTKHWSGLCSKFVLYCSLNPYFGIKRASVFEIIV